MSRRFKRDRAARQTQTFVSWYLGIGAGGDVESDVMGVVKVGGGPGITS